MSGNISGDNERDLQQPGLARVIERVWVSTSRETTNVFPRTPSVRALATIDKRKVYYKIKNMRERNSVTYKSSVKIVLTKT